jgi:hypothetical protein
MGPEPGRCGTSKEPTAMNVPPSHDPFGGSPDWTAGSSGPPPIYSQQPTPAPGPHPWNQQPRAGGAGSHLHWWIGGAVLGVVALVAVVVLLTVGGHDSTPTRPPVASSAAAVPPGVSTASPTQTSAAAPANLSGLLLPIDDINSRLKTTTTAAPGESGSAPLSIAVTPPNCTSAYAPATGDGYRGAGYSELAVRGFRGPGGAVSTSVIEAVAKFPDAAAAQDFYHRQFADWKSCKYTAVSATYSDGAGDHIKMGIPGDDGTTVIDSAFGAGGATCERTMTVKAAYVIDVRVCRSGGGAGNAGGYGLSLAHAIQRNIT